MTDTIADTLTRLKNATERSKEATLVVDEKLSKNILEILTKEGFIDKYTEVEGGLEVLFKFNENGDPVVTQFEKVSKPGQRIYVNAKNIIPVMNGRGISIISTSKGLMTGSMAKAQGIGGEYICNIW